MSLEQVCDDIVTMKIRGAAKIGRSAAQALVDHTKEIQTDGLTSLEFYDKVLDAAKKLKATRPTAVSLSNSLHYTIRGLAKEGSTPEEMKELVISQGEEFVQNSMESIGKVAQIGGELIKDGDTLLTICNSSVALGVMFKAHADGKKIRVYSAESRPRYQGRITVKQLAEKGIEVTMIVDSAVHHFMQKVDKVFVGADAINSRGEVFNKIGTSQVSLIAKEYNRPFYVCAETYKFAPQTLFGETIEIEERDEEEIADPADFPGVNIINPAFDKTPAPRITGIITERGIIPPEGAITIIQEISGLMNKDL